MTASTVECESTTVIVETCTNDGNEKVVMTVTEGTEI